MNTLLSSSSIHNTTVVNAQGTTLGDIKDLMVDPQTGSVEYAVLDFGGFLGIGTSCSPCRSRPSPSTAATSSSCST